MAEIETTIEYRVRLTREELEALKRALQAAINSGATPGNDIRKLRDDFSGALNR